MSWASKGQARDMNTGSSLRNQVGLRVVGGRGLGALEKAARIPFPRAMRMLAWSRFCLTELVGLSPGLQATG